MKRVAIIIPTLYQPQPQNLLECLVSLEKAVKPAKNVLEPHFILVENHVPLSQDERSIERMMLNKTKIKPTVQANHINKGFTGAVNDGITYAQLRWAPDWYLVINDDAVVTPSFFRALFPLLQSGTNNLVSCKVIKPDGKVESVGLDCYPTGLAFPRTKDVGETTAIPYCGTCFFLSKPTVEAQLNKYGYVLNPLYFAYAEDLELSLRILKDGGRIAISNTPLVVHQGSQTAKRGSWFQLYYGLRNWIFTIILLWPIRRILTHFPLLLLGQFYALLLTLRKGYIFLYPRIIWAVGRRMKILLYLRSRYL